MNRRIKFRRRTKVIGGIVLVLVASLYIVHVVNVRNRQAILEKVVEQMRLAQLKPGQEKQFTLTADDTKSLVSLFPTQVFGGRFTGTVWGTVAPDGSLKIVIQTYEQGHLGSEGLVYSDTLLSSDPESTDWDWDIRSPPVNSMSAIDEHWWRMHWSD